ncbi:hypothetical protein LTR10_012589 [Elasticomyces elasticus]|nr:hypothetical protein LTR10_012589 [Elasticomyces elasticus]KAK5043364.1 hypothetical protein LTR13_001135 [Exophiala sideris]
MDNVCVPVRVDAFVLSPEIVAKSQKSLIAPVTQPNYAFLRYDASVIQHDILPHHDLHAATPAVLNSRVTDLGTGNIRPERLGVYLHWVLPRVYRSGTAAANSASDKQTARREQQGFAPVSGDAAKAPDYSSPDFRSAPNRWVVIRRLEPGSYDTSSGLPEVDAWVVESDRLRAIDDLRDDDIEVRDIEVSLAPFIDPGAAVKQQAEFFIGYRESINTWQEYQVKQGNDPNKPRRALLSLLNASNPIFADYQPHNGHVFSFVDNFRYQNPKGKPGDADEYLYLQNAKASYFIFGWHEEGDPEAGNLDPMNFQTPADPKKNPPQTYAERLNTCFMMLKGQPFGKDSPEDTWSKQAMSADTASKIVCHGAMYDVVWDIKNPPKHIPADSVGAKLAHNVTVGTTPLDAMLAYAASQVPAPPPPSPTKDDRLNDVVLSPPPVTPEELETDLLKIQTLLLKQEDGVDPQLQAEDILYEANFAKSEGGVRWHLSGTDNTKSLVKGHTATTSGANLASLDLMNVKQMAYNLCTRESDSVQWQLFAQWWKYVSEEASNRDKLTQETKNIILALMDRLTILMGPSIAEPSPSEISDLKTAIDGLKSGISVPVEQGAEDRFYMQKDPTVLVAGVQSGWPSNFATNNIQVRIDTQVMSTNTWGGSLPSWSRWSDLCESISSKVPSAINSTVNKLLAEFYNLQYSPKSTPATDSNTQFPTFHDSTGAGTTPGFDSFADTQAWFPLFIEWEVAYYHLPSDVWNLQDRISRSGLTIPRYGIDPNVCLGGNVGNTQKSYHDDVRTLSGRILLLPQPANNLANIVTQVLRNTDTKTLNDVYHLSEDDQDRLRTNIGTLQYLSAPLSGFIDHIATRAQGTHIKPSRRAPSGRPSFLQEALDACNNPPSLNIGLTEVQVEFMGASTDKTPYGNMVGLVDNDYCPFKPVTHGQFAFTKLNIIDKFGQAAFAINPTPVPSDQQPQVYPCVSDYFLPAKVQHGEQGNTVPDTVLPDKDGACRFVQVPPLINQPARLNSSFVLPDAANTGRWKRATEHDNPIWGWIVLNYADNGLQLFLQNGIFYREIRLGAKGTNVSPAWLPLQKPPMPPDPNNLQQLDKLVTQLTDPTSLYLYLRSVFAMVNEALANQPAVPNAHAGSLPSLVGKPLALVNYGIALELATEPLSNQISSTSTTVKTPEQQLLDYWFPVKMGDAQRAYDGLVSYFPATIRHGEVDLDLTKIYTFFTHESVTPDPAPSPAPNPPSLLPRVSIGVDNYPQVKPYYIYPSPLVQYDPNQPTPPPSPPPPTDPATLAQQHNQKLSVFGAIVDPFTSLHFYSGILPIQTLTLPPWTIASAMKKMTAFFHMGPIVVVDNIANEVVADKILTDDYNMDNMDKYMIPSDAVGVPALSVVDWAWLQPFYNTTAPEKPDFNAFELKAIDNTPRWQKGPYTALEGYLQSKKPLVRPDS